MHIDPVETVAGPGLLCSACGARMTLDPSLPISDAMRPFVEEHRDCEPRAVTLPAPREVLRMEIDLTGAGVHTPTT